MGNKSSNDNNQNNAVDPLTMNPQVQDAYRNIYSNTSDMPLYPGAYAMGDPGLHSKQPKLEVKKTQTVSLDFNIEKNSIAFIRGNDLASYYLKFRFSSKTDVAISLHYNGREMIDSANNTEYIYVDEMMPPVKEYIFSVGTNQDFPQNTSVLHSKYFSTDAMTTYTTDRFPLIIKMVHNFPTIQQNSGAIFYVYVVFNPSKEGYTGKILKQKLQIGSKSFVLDDIFGISTSGLKDPNAPEAKDCAICLTTKIDTVVLPCKHMCLCFECAQNLRTKNDSRCPLCRNNVESYVKLENMNATK